MVQVHYKGDWFKIIFHLLNLLLIRINGITEIAGSGPIGQKAYKESMKHIMNNYGNNK